MARCTLHILQRRFPSRLSRILACKVNHTSVHALVWVANNDASRFYQLQSALAAFPADCGIQIHPVHSCDEVIHTVTRLSLFLDTEHEDIVQGKIAQAMEELPEMDMASQDIWLPLIAGMSGTANNLSHHDCFVIQEGAQSLARIASASVAELRDFSLDKSTAMAVRAFFEEETV
ncbi:hypothetical protein DFJ77DRAFT_448032, partial [Powellomyces hirtus]